MLLRLIYDDSLAQASYLIGCQATGEAIIFDPERDIDRYVQLAAANGLRIVAAAETHIHADFLAGTRQLAEELDVMVYVSGEGGPDWSYGWLDDRVGGGQYHHRLLHDGDTFQVGHIRFRAMHTPGHTPEHICYEVTDLGAGASEPMGLVTGDFVFVGDLGRPDLLETAAGIDNSKEEGARALAVSAVNFLKQEDHLQVWPAHGSGSACGKALGAVPQSTVGYERRFNRALQISGDSESFVEFILQDQPDPPYYFARMKQLNRDGVPVLSQLPNPEQLTAEKLASLNTNTCAVVDTRSWPEYRSGHLAGSLHPLRGVGFLASVGSFVQPDEDIVLIVERDQLEEAVRRCVRIGLDRVVGWASPSSLTVALASIGGGDTIEEIGPDDFLSATEAGAVVLDVRTTGEVARGAVEGSIRVPYTRLLGRLEELPSDRPILVHCAAGVRSAAACSLIARNGGQPINLAGGYGGWVNYCQSTMAGPSGTAR